MGAIKVKNLKSPRNGGDTKVFINNRFCGTVTENEVICPEDMSGTWIKITGPVGKVLVFAKKERGNKNIDMFYQTST